MDPKASVLPTTPQRPTKLQRPTHIRLIRSAYSTFCCRLVGTYSIFAQQLIQDGELIINDPLVDNNNKMLEVITNHLL